MANALITIIIVVFLMVGIRETKKHFKRQGGCCGGGGSPEKVPEKKLEKVIGQKTAHIEGMTCEHCKNWVEKAINGIEGASGKVNLKKKEAVISMSREISDEEIRRAISGAGYKVTEIS